MKYAQKKNIDYIYLYYIYRSFLYNKEREKKMKRKERYKNKKRGKCCKRKWGGIKKKRAPPEKAQ